MKPPKSSRPVRSIHRPGRCLRAIVAAIAVLASACAAVRPLVERPSSALCAHVDLSQKRLAVAGRWRGREVRVAIDTGGAGGSVSKRIAASLAPRPGEPVRYAGAAGKWIDASMYDVDGLSLGAATLATFAASDMALLDDEGYDFQIGVDQLAPYVVDLAMNEGLVCLRSELPAGVAAASLSTLVRTGGDITVEATIAGKRFPAMAIDTGAGVSTINEDLLSTIPHRRLDEFRVRSVDASGVEKDEYFVEVPSLCVLGACEPRTQLMPGSDLSALVGHSQTGLVGVPFLRRHRIIFDFKDRKIGIDPG